MTLDELVKDIDVQDVRNKNLTDEKVASIYLDVENVKNNFRKFAKIFCYAGLILVAAIILGFILHLLFPDIEWLWESIRYLLDIGSYIFLPRHIMEQTVKRELYG